ncbi:transcriptional regulator with XRE-family HTH domain [Oxalobacteraceae bacterium GrIS 1.11]
MTLAQLIRLNRQKLGISQLELAQKLGVSQAAIGQWEREVTAPRAKNFPELSKIFDIDVEQIIAAADELETYQRERPRYGEPDDTREESHPLSASTRGQIAWANSQYENEHILLARHKEDSKRFDDELFDLLPNMGLLGNRNVRINGLASRSWVADYASERSIIEVKHPIRSSSLQMILPNTLWTLTLLRAVRGVDQNYMAIIRLPSVHNDDQDRFNSNHRMRGAIERHALDASLVGLKLRAVESVEEAAKWITEAEHDLFEPE